MNSDAWAQAIKEIASLLKKWGGAFFAFLAGRDSKQREIERAERKALEKELQHEREEDAIMSDPIAIERMRERWSDTE